MLDQAGVVLSLPSECWNYRCVLPHPAGGAFTRDGVTSILGDNSSEPGEILTRQELKHCQQCFSAITTKVASAAMWGLSEDPRKTEASGNLSGFYCPSGLSRIGIPDSRSGMSLTIFQRYPGGQVKIWRQALGTRGQGLASWP